MVFKTIIADILDLGIAETKNPKVIHNILKFNSEMKKLGIKKIHISQTRVSRVTPNILNDDLTLIFKPCYDDLNYSERRYTRDSFNHFRDYLVGLSGSPSLGMYYGLSVGSFEKIKKLKILFEGKKYHIGDYLKDRNTILIYLPANTGNWDLGKENEYLIALIGFIKEVFTTYKIKVKDVKALREELLISIFTQKMNKEINNKKDFIRNSEINLKDYEKSLINCYSTIFNDKKIIINLEKMLKELKENLLEKVEQIKKLKFVKECKLSEEGITFKFDRIFIKIKGKNIEMGDYLIKIMPNTIKIINSNPVIQGGVKYHSCHIRDNDVCFGGGKTIAFELLGKMELKKLAHFIYLYLKSYNPEDTYLSMDLWIKGKENKGIVPDESGENENYCSDCGDYYSEDYYNFDEECCDNCYAERLRENESQRLRDESERRIASETLPSPAPATNTDTTTHISFDLGQDMDGDTNDNNNERERVWN